ncbi:MAG: C69 family dipeptidase [Acetilactobacillus jinshanensis]
MAMSATETTFTNERFLGADPLVDKGINEEDIPTLVLPYIDNARQGVKRLGKLLAKYGTAESNGIAFSDKNEVWYLETAGGHHWVAERIPDDAYAIAPNQMMIQDVDFNDPDHFMYSAVLRDFVKEHHLNNHPGSFNFRNIAGTHSTWDSRYNTPRAWYGQKMFNPEIKQRPTSQEIPFIHHTDRKISVQDVEHFLSSHYQRTPYDPFTNPKRFNHPAFRPIAIDRNAASHILQIRNDVPDKYAGIEWLALGLLSYSPFVPFYANISETPKNYRITGQRVSMRSAYWMFKSLLVYIEPHYHDFIDEVNAYRTNVQAYALHRIGTVDKAVKSVNEINR